MQQSDYQYKEVLQSPLLQSASVGAQNALALAQRAIYLEENKKYQESMEFFEKAALLLEQESEECSSDLEVILNSLAQSYSNKSKLLLSELRKQQLIESDDRLLIFDVMDPYYSFILPSQSQLSDSVEIGTNDTNSVFNSLESLLNVLDEEERIRDTVRIMLRTMTKGENISKRLFVSPSVWLMPEFQTDQQQNSEQQMSKWQILIDVERSISQVLVACKYSPSQNIQQQIEKLRKLYLSIYQNSTKLLKEQSNNNNNGNTNNYSNNNNNNNNNANDIYEQYKSSLLKQLRKIYKQEDKYSPLDYFHCVFRLLRNILQLFILFDRQINNSKSSNYNQQELASLQRDKFFITIFFRDCPIKIILNDLQSKFNQYISFSKKKIL